MSPLHEPQPRSFSKSPISLQSGARSRRSATSWSLSRQNVAERQWPTPLCNVTVAADRPDGAKQRPGTPGVAVSSAGTSAAAGLRRGSPPRPLARRRRPPARPDAPDAAGLSRRRLVVARFGLCDNRLDAGLVQLPVDLARQLYRDARDGLELLA
jgi:hypothetical protein